MYWLIFFMLLSTKSLTSACPSECRYATLIYYFRGNVKKVDIETNFFMLSVISNLESKRLIIMVYSGK